MHDDCTFELDEHDKAFIAGFMEENGGSIPAGAVVEGFISLISWVNPDGTLGWRLYNALDRPTSTVVGLLEMAKFDYMRFATDSGEDDG